jgi:hypothetical protein
MRGIKRLKNTRYSPLGVFGYQDGTDVVQRYHSFAATGEDPEMLVKAALVDESVEKQVEEKMEKMEDASMELATVVQPAVVEDVKADESTSDLPREAEIDDAEKSDAVSERAEPLPQTPVGEAPFPFAQQHPAGPTMGFAVGGSKSKLSRFQLDIV